VIAVLAGCDLVDEVVVAATGFWLYMLFGTDQDAAEADGPGEVEHTVAVPAMCACGGVVLLC
jgi:hypothetical protein